MVKGPASRLLFPGGSRSGKTFFIIYAIVMRAAYAPGSRHLICRHRFNAAKAAIWMDTLKKVLSFFSADLYSLNETDHVVHWANGSEIWVDGLDQGQNLERILGREYVTIYFNECSQIKYSTVADVLSRLAQDTGCKPKAFFDLNPRGKGHWTYKIWIDHMDPIEDKPLPNPERYALVYSTAYDNRENLNAEYIPEVLETYSGDRRKRFLEGKYADDDGSLVFPLGKTTLYTWADFVEWRSHQHEEDLRTTGGLDLGFEDSDALAIIVYSVVTPERWLIYEAKERHQPIEDLANMVREGLAYAVEHKLPKPNYIYTDSGGGGKRTMVDLSAAYGLPTAPAYKSDKASGILMLQEELRAGTLKIPAAGILYHETQRTVWADDEDTGRREIDDSQYHPDLVDAVLYAMRYVWYYYTKKD